MSDRPVSISNNDISREDSLLKTDFVPTPFIATEQRIFEDSIVIKIGSSKINNLKQRLYFSIYNGVWQDYINPITIYE